MEVMVNGARRAIDPGHTLGQLLQDLGTTRWCAAALDGEVVPREEWQHIALAAGQTVEVLTAVQGG